MKKITLTALFVSSLLASSDVNVHENNVSVENNESLNYSTLSRSTDVSDFKEVENASVRTNFSHDEKDEAEDSIYNFTYSPLEENKKSPSNANIFLTGSFEKIYRYDSLIVEYSAGTEESSDGESEKKEASYGLDENSDKTFERIVQRIKDHQEDKTKEVLVSVISYTKSTEDKAQKLSTGNWFTNFFQSVGQYEGLEDNNSKEIAANYGERVFELLKEQNISESIIYKENREGNDNLYSEGLSEGRDLNNRVEVTVYLKAVYDPDTDKDGVRDSKDFCPETPMGSRVDKNGCPIILKLDLQFEFDNDVIEDEKSYTDILRLANFLKRFPAYRVMIIGHTDAQGNDSYNLKLSKRRAALVVSVLEDDGIDPVRLSSDGRGESEPIASNDTKEGRFENRRTEVELTLIDEEKEKKGLKKRRRGAID